MKFTIERMGQHGDGLAMVDGAPLALPKTLLGEVVDVDYGKLLCVISPSAERQEAFCAKFDVCGGCKFQHWKKEPYSEWKRSQVISALENKGLRVSVETMIEAHGEGRRRVSLHVREKDGVWSAGFMAAKSHDLCAIDTCPVLVKSLQHAPHIAASFGPILGPCDVAITAADNGLDVAVKAERSAVPRRNEVLQGIFREHQLLRLSVNGDVLASLAKPFVKMGSVDVPLSLNSFLQATAKGEDVLSALVTEGVGKSKNIVDLFCGVGPFALRLAEKAKVAAYDSDKPAIACLQQAVKMARGLKPLIAEARDLFKAPLVAMELKAFDAAVLDPPRAGAEAQARNLAKSTVKRVVSVSCDAQSFARDAAILVKGGYRMTRVVPVDQFCWTPHVEIVGWFER
jgi:23S rRNA (uracil1939-C5)-methyltransferase